jgi:hypothetical protein
VDSEPEVVEEPASDEEGIVQVGPGILSLSLLGLWTLCVLAWQVAKDAAFARGAFAAGLESVPSAR